MEYKNIKNPFKVLNCFLCRRDLINSTHFQCVDCKEKVVICVVCFREGKENPPDHLKTHSYQVV
jgi:hypothetical protein